MRTFNRCLSRQRFQNDYGFCFATGPGRSRGSSRRVEFVQLAHRRGRAGVQEGVRVCTGTGLLRSQACRAPCERMQQGKVPLSRSDGFQVKRFAAIHSGTWRLSCADSDKPIGPASRGRRLYMQAGPAGRKNYPRKWDVLPLALTVAH